MPKVRLCENVNYGGRPTDSNLDEYFIWNGAWSNGGILYSSIQINVEDWVLFGDTLRPSFDRDDNLLLVYGPHNIPDLTQIVKHDNQLWPLGQDGNWNDKITRVQYGVQPNQIEDIGRYRATVIAPAAAIYKDGNFGRPEEGILPGRGNLEMNDDASSVFVPPGFLLTLYWDANQGGAAYSFPAGQHPSVPAEFNDQASSYWLRRSH